LTSLPPLDIFALVKRVVSLVVALGACNQALDAEPLSETQGLEDTDVGVGAAENVDSEAPTTSVPTTEAEAIASSIADAGLQPVPAALTDADCYYLAGEIAAAWPRIDDALQRAAARWERFYVPGSASCAVRLLSSQAPGFDDWGRRGDILLNPNETEIVDSDTCEGEHYLLIDVLTHELGYVYGLEWTGARGRAMSSHDYCETVVPTAAEIEAAK
jgi:hypothetical protein